MIYGLSHVQLAVTDLPRAERFYTGPLEFQVKQRGDGFVDLDARSLVLRLYHVARVESRAALRLQVGDVARCVSLLEAAGGQVVHAAERTAELELLATLNDPDGHALCLWRPLSEDEYGFVPELPKAGEWTAAGEELLKSLLLSVPSLFRALARRKVAREAEALATHGPVDRETVIRAFIRSSAKVTRDRVRAPLQRHGVDLGRYQEDFDA
ncbi:MAG: DUF2621 family protein [Myxococcaceae bacterium]